MAIADLCEAVTWLAGEVRNLMPPGRSHYEILQCIHSCDSIKDDMALKPRRAKPRSKP